MMSYITKDRLTFKFIILYYLLFFAIWFLRNILLSIGNDWVNAFSESILKTIIWIIPCIFLLKQYENSVTITLKEMFCNKVNWFRYIPIFALFAIYFLFAAYKLYGRIGIAPGFSPLSLIGGFVFVGITEEMVFRGWLLNATLKMMKPALAILLNAVMFLFIHFPKWICSGMFISSILNFGVFALMALSVIFSIAFIRSKNILVPIFLHMFYDLMYFLFIPS